MRYGFVLPGGTAPEQLEQAVLAEQAGWDGVFVWEGAYGVDAWTLLAAMAAKTERIRLGTMLTPLPWRRPWKLASQVVTLDQVSNGRAILAVGLGAVDTMLGDTGEVTDRRERAGRLDEGIDLIRAHWEGRLAYSGQHFQVDLAAREDLGLIAQPVQSPIPIWVVGAWPRPKSMRRILRADGLLPVVMEDGTFAETKPEHVRAMLEWLRERGGAGEGFEVIMEGETPADDPERARAIVAPWAEAGCTWWLDARWAMPHESAERMQQVNERLAAGPPRVD
jgi:alkanesulfonate monooxygenase SsuD/methylene tetrahydromethanopterin reductase-like flavin-dependent oxidoreductase (luciferase family)